MIAFPFAYWLARYVLDELTSRLLLVLVILPFWTSYLLRVYSWLTILGDQGAINRFLQWTGITHQPVSFFLYDRPAVILVLVYLYFPFAALTLYASLERFDWDQLTRGDGSRRASAGRRCGGSCSRRCKPGIIDRGDLRLHPDPRRVPDAAARRRRAGRDDREPDRELLPGRAVHARRRGGAARSRR